MNKFYNTIFEEQETIININYAESKVHIYTCQKSVHERLLKKIGNPTKIYYTNKKISGAKWEIPFEEKRCITQILSRPTLIGQRK